MKHLSAQLTSLILLAHGIGTEHQPTPGESLNDWWRVWNYQRCL